MFLHVVITAMIILYSHKTTNTQHTDWKIRDKKTRTTKDVIMHAHPVITLALYNPGASVMLTIYSNHL